MKRAIMIILAVLFMMSTGCAFAEEQPAAELPMPSLGEFLHRYPDSETTDEAGNTTEIFQGMTEATFEEFGQYLIEKGAAFSDSTREGAEFSAGVQIDGGVFSVRYNAASGEVTLVYPAGVYDARMRDAKNKYNQMVDLINEGKPAEALAVYDEIPDKELYTAATELLPSTQGYEEGADIPTGQPWIGINVVFLPEDTWKKAGPPAGAYLLGATENSPAAKAGLQAGDIVVEFNGVEIKAEEDIGNAFSGVHVGQKVIARVWRPNKVTDAESHNISSKGEYLDAIEILIEARE